MQLYVKTILKYYQTKKKKKIYKEKKAFWQYYNCKNVMRNKICQNMLKKKEIKKDLL